MSTEVDLAALLIRARPRHDAGCTQPWVTFTPEHVSVNETCQCYGGGNKCVAVPIADWPAVVAAVGDEVGLVFHPLVR